MAGGANKYGLSVPGHNQDFGDSLRVLEPDVGPIVTAIGRPVHTIAHGSTVALPGFSRADPDILRVRWVNGNGADRLHLLMVKNRPEVGSAVDGLPHSSAGRAYVKGGSSFFVHSRQCRDSSTHFGGADIPRRQPRNGSGVELDGRNARRLGMDDGRNRHGGDGRAISH